MKYLLPRGLTVRKLAVRVWNASGDDAIFGRAAQLSYYFVLSIFPLLLLLTGILGLFAEPGSEVFQSLMRYIRTATPGAVGDLLRDVLVEISQGTGNFILSVGAITALWAASAGMRAIIDGLNVAYRVPEARPWWKAILVAIALTVATALMIVVALVTLIWGVRIGAYVADQFGLGTAFQIAWQILHWPLVIAFVFLAFMLVYRYAPNVAARNWRWNAPGALVGMGLWVLLSVGLRIYVGQFGDYNRLYGSLGAVIILMLWLYLTGAAILIGGEVNYAIGQAAAQAGERGAEVHEPRRAA
ncbi:MAG TPA: YihY/virulence factor BrkB family protein [Bryobacteraceae bacterium]|nr:YihY/virulence factor BrkB family protein [Bryobacteraceae bacterium]